ncbi:uncharacterized protein B0I36DRAFT_358007 [Microdochium trichocladiopsis]|uniref:DUF2293 domain-containing protein n=1 Tax=Microdochium trichocladiopsis TaxID=1682393 RepID=A0A9P9BWM3_9PEZI|nr:uncharacterized protein B0I36DRAFT_358007 [Microdochium trichocladiopsis]KAH7040740.1 hypothetical protein B0I36DRAFT_358007 [Microdochium trichocladiopsis]
MGREKKKAPAAPRMLAAQARRAKHERAKGYKDGVWQNLTAVNPAPTLKHKSYYESMQNTEKKKKLDFEILTDREPPPGFEFVPTGHPELTNACKELSREQDALFFIDSKDTTILDHHMNRVGCHFRQTIVDEARQNLQSAGILYQPSVPGLPGQPEPIPKSQTEINRQADAVLRDFFPRIPNTDRHEIIAHAFKKDGKFHGEYKVGMAKDLTLARRVQLAALAHIRHTMTRYDELLKETDWANARKAVEKPCLDIIVKWRGDEETGRDQLDEILREVIEISDTDDDSEDESSGLQSPDYGFTDRSAAASPMVTSTSHTPSRPAQPSSMAPFPAPAMLNCHDPATPPRHKAMVPRSERRTARKAAKAAQRFKRYAAAADAIADERALSSLHPAPHRLLDSPRMGDASVSKAFRQEGSGSSSSILPVGRSGYPAEYTDRISNQPGHAVIAQSDPLRHDAPFFVQRVVPASVGFEQLSERAPPRAIHVTRAQQEPLMTYSRTALQDLLVPSVEPASPQGPPPAFYPLRERHGHLHESALPPPDDHSSGGHAASAITQPQFTAHNGSHRDHRPAVTFFPEDYERPSRPTLVPLPTSDTAHDRVAAGYSYQQSEPARTVITTESMRPRITEYYGQHSGEREHFGSGLVSSQANPIVVNDDAPRYIEREGARYVPVRQGHAMNSERHYLVERRGYHDLPSASSAGYVHEPTQRNEPVVLASYTNRAGPTHEQHRTEVSTAETKSHFGDHHFGDHDLLLVLYMLIPVILLSTTSRCRVDKACVPTGTSWFSLAHPKPNLRKSHSM